MLTEKLDWALEYIYQVIETDEFQKLPGHVKQQLVEAATLISIVETGIESKRPTIEK